MTRALPLLIAIATVGLFWPATGHDWVWDDRTELLDNPRWQGLGAEQLAWMFGDVTGHYQPLTWLSLALDVQLWGLVPFGVHLTNVLLHALNAVLVWALLRALLVRAAPERPGAAWAAALGAALFAWHPLRVESVAWAVERRDVLSAAFLLAATLAYLRAVEADGDRRWWGLVVLGFLASLLSRAGGVVWPVALLVLDGYPLRRLGKRAVLEKGPLLLLALPFAWLAPRAQRASGALVDWASHTLDERIGQAAYGLVFYPARTLVPVKLSPLVELPSTIAPLEAPYVWCGVAAVALTVAAIAVAQRWPAVSAAWAWYLVFIGPLLGLTQVGPHLVADRYAYLSCLGLAALVAGGAWRLGRRGAAVGAVLCLALLPATRAQLAHWQDETTLWTRAAAVDPDGARIRFQLGKAHLDAGRHDEAIAALDASTRAEPRFAHAWLNLGAALTAAHREPRRAAEALDRALSLLPDHPSLQATRGKAHLERGILLALQEKGEPALADLDRAVALLAEAPPQTRARARYHRGEAHRLAANARYRRIGRLSMKDALFRRARDAAIADYDAAIALDADYALAYRGRGYARLKGSADEADRRAARRDLEKATALDRSLWQTWAVLGELYAIGGQRLQARTALDQALRAAPEASKARVKAMRRTLLSR